MSKPLRSSGNASEHSPLSYPLTLPQVSYYTAASVNHPFSTLQFIFVSTTTCLPFLSIPHHEGCIMCCPRLVYIDRITLGACRESLRSPLFLLQKLFHYILFQQFPVFRYLVLPYFLSCIALLCVQISNTCLTVLVLSLILYLPTPFSHKFTCEITMRDHHRCLCAIPISL